MTARFCRLMCSLLIYAAICCGRDRALLIGIGDYPLPIPHLPGIALDLTAHTRALQQLGFAPDTIRVLTGDQATIGGIRRQIREWLAAGAAPDDRICLYFSGHGSLVQDARGRTFAVLIPYDTKITNTGLSNVLSGAELSALLGEIHSNRILVVIDACHSGHFTETSKGVGSVPKLLRYPGMPQTSADFLIEPFAGKGLQLDIRSAHVLLAACRRDELALATPRGSVLTLALVQAVNDLLRRRNPVTLRAVHPLLAGYVEPGQHPEVSGDEGLRGFDWSVHKPVSLPLPPAPHASPRPRASACPQVPLPRDWALLGELYVGRAGDLAIRNLKPEYRNQESMELEIDVPFAGYLNIVSVGQRDSAATVLFPNAYTTTNRVSPGRFRIPDSPAYYFSQQTSCPTEDNEIVVLLSVHDVNLFRDGVGTEAFKQFGELTRSAVVLPTNGFRAGFAKFRIAQ